MEFLYEDLGFDLPRPKHGQTPRALREIDCLLLVNDEARQGALRFAQQPGRTLSA